MKTALLSALVLCPPALAAPLANPPVAPPRVTPVHETVFGIAMDDPYRWMEDPANLPEMTAWLEKSTTATTADLARLPERAAFATLLQQATQAGVRFRSATAAGAKLFFLRQEPDEPVAKLVLREAGHDRVLLDPMQNQTGVAAIGTYSVSPDGNMVAVQVAQGGGEMGAVRFINVATGAQKGSPIAPVWGEMTVTWLPHGVAAYVRAADPGPTVDPTQNMHVALIDPGDRGPGKLVLGAGIAAAPAMNPVEMPALTNAPLSPYVLGTSGGAQQDERLFATTATSLAAGTPTWRTIATYNDQVTNAALLADHVYLLTTKNSPHGQIERRSLAPASTPPTIVLPEGPLVLTDLGATKDGLYVSAQRDGISHLLFLPDGTGHPRELALPFDGDLSDLQVDQVDGESLTFSLVGWSQPTTFFRARAGLITPLGLASAAWSGSAAATAIRDQALSADGTRVPMVILLPRSATTKNARATPLPTLLEGYGAYGINTTSPFYAPAPFTWIAHGGAMALCGTRGGGERGRAWADAGRAQNKPSAQADFIACAQQLEASGITKPSMLVAMGTSAGGALVPFAVLKRPDLFAGLIERVGLVNPTRLAVAENGPNQYVELGDPRTQSGFAALRAEDSYQQLGLATDIPDTLVTIGLNDRRVAPWMSTKFAARARAKFGATRLVLIRAETQAGHGIGSSRNRLIAESADTLAFAWHITHTPH